MRNVFACRTPIDDECPTCLETRAELLIYPGQMSPQEVTNRLGIDPTKVNVAGEEAVNKHGGHRRVTDRRRDDVHQLRLVFAFGSRWTDIVARVDASACKSSPRLNRTGFGRRTRCPTNSELND